MCVFANHFELIEVLVAGRLTTELVDKPIHENAHIRQETGDNQTANDHISVNEEPLCTEWFWYIGVVYEINQWQDGNYEVTKQNDAQHLNLSFNLAVVEADSGYVFHDQARA